MYRGLRHFAWLSLLHFVALSQGSQAATPSADQALKLTPMQSGVDYDRPTAEEAPKCKIVAKKINGHVGWIVEGPAGLMLRRFVDTNNDNVVDQWSYFKDGLEVYRDIDSNYNGKPDQHRWFNTAGARWGVDTNEDGVIDSWKTISAEEVTAEVVAAIANRDVERFNRLLLTSNELKSLGLGKIRAEKVADKLTKATQGFKTLVADQRAFNRNTVWVQFSANRPGVVPAGTDQSTRDMFVYENAMAIVESAGKHGQVQIGTLVQVGDVWRLIDTPQISVEGQADAGPHGFFFVVSTSGRNDAGTNANSEVQQKLLAELETLDQQAAQATTASDQANYTKRRADLLWQIAAASRTADERASWIRQLADMLAAAVQMGTYPDGVERLATIAEKLQKNPADRNLAACVRFRQLTAANALAMQAPKADYAKIQSEWLKSLEQYVTDYPGTPDAAEAMFQLAIGQEFAGQESEADKWYSRIVKEFANTPEAKKAAGAQTRLDAVGKTISFNGQSPLGSPVDLANYRGKVVLIQYWATYSASAKADMATLKELWNKYGRNFTIISVSLDNEIKDLNAYLDENPLPWPQVFEQGGLESRPANALGIITVPTMILVDQQGKVVDRSVSVANLEAELKKLIR